MSVFLKLILDCDIYVQVKDDLVFITVPAYDIRRRSPVKFSVSEGKVSFFYYKYYLELDLNDHTGFANVADLKERKKFRIKYAFISETEFGCFSKVVDRTEMLKKKYECTRKEKIKFFYDMSQGDGEFAGRIMPEVETIRKDLNWLLSWAGHCSTDDCNGEFTLPIILSAAEQGKKYYNCKNMALILNTIYLRQGFKSRYIICLQSEEEVEDSHFMVEVYLNELKKWILIDSSYGLLFKDESSNYLSMREVRDRMAERETVCIDMVGRLINMDLYWKNLIKKLYRFRRPIRSDGMFSEKTDCVELVPQYYNCDKNNIRVIDDPAVFWEN